jgi:hypothetical protein
LFDRRKGWHPPAEHEIENWLRSLQPLSRRRLFLIDEPERHLHPARQRAMASWIFDTMRERQSQIILATHAPAFLGLPADVQHVYVNRTDDTVRLEHFEVEDLAALHEIARSVGFDRGELLTNSRVLLFVEGRADQLVFERLFPVELRSAGVVIVPVHGAAKLEGVSTAEVLLRFTTAPVALLYDNVAPELVNAVRDDAGFRERVRHSTTREFQELRWIAHLYSTTEAHRRPVTALSLRAKDIFDLLDEEAIRQLFPDFPGHTRANAEWEIACEHKHVDRKVFYEATYKIPNHLKTFEGVIDQMNRRRVRPDQLVDLLVEVERLTLSDAAPPGIKS